MSRLDSSMHILVVDDVPVMRTLVIKSLREAGYTKFSEFENGQDAWDGLKSLQVSNPIDFIVSDITMPRMTGLDFLKKVRSDAQFKALPFLMVTAESEKPLILDAIQNGVSGYLMKPFLPDQLRQKFAAAIDALRKKQAA